MCAGILSLLMALGPAAPGADEPKQTDPPAAGDVAAAETLQGEVVLVDVEAKVLNIKRSASDVAAAEVSLVMEGDAVTAAADLKAGDAVSVTCREGTKGEACVVVGVKKTAP
jgi:hypothetical protein